MRMTHATNAPPFVCHPLWQQRLHVASAMPKKRTPYGVRFFVISGRRQGR